MRDRSNQVDLALAFAATFVITLTLWPRSAPRQIVRCQTSGSPWKTFSIALDDPSLEVLKDKVHQWSTPEMQPKYVTAKWQKEVAEFYESCQPCESVDADVPTTETHQPATATISDTVTTASYEVDADDRPASGISRTGLLETDTTQVTSASDTSASETAASAIAAKDDSDADYWSIVKASAVRSMEAIKRRSENVPVVFGEQTRRTSPQLAYHVAFLLGLIAACGYMHWLRLSPLRKHTSFRDQPLTVLARIGTFTGGNLFAILCAAMLWMD